MHIDYAGPFMNTMFFIFVNVHTKWVESFRTPPTTSGAKTVVSDNASYFTSTEFEEFLTLNGVMHVTATPYLPE